MTARKGRPAGVLLGLCLLTANVARAKPGWNVGAEAGVTTSDNRFGLRHFGFGGAVHADLMLLRERSSDFGLGPALRIATRSFDDLRLDAGLSLLLPITESFPLVLEAGPHLRNLDEPGVYGSAFFGLRSLNHYGSYEMAAGLVLSAERSFGAGTPSTLWLTARVDGAWLALPFIFAYGALK